MNRERLLNLRTILVDHQNNGYMFHLGMWAAYFGQTEDGKCRTAACACGLYAIKRPEDGLRLVDRYHVHEPELLERAMSLGQVTLFYQATPGSREYTHIDAAAVFFDLPHMDACKLFLANYYPHLVAARITPQDVLDRLDRLLLLPPTMDMSSEWRNELNLRDENEATA